MNDASRLAELVATWRQAIAEFVALARDVPEDQWDLPTDLDGWSVKDNVAHTAHLEAVLAGTPEETAPVETGGHVKNLSGHYTEQGVVARRGRDMASLADEIEQAAAKRGAALDAEPPTDGASPPPKTPGDAPWSTEQLLSNRPVDIWMHEQDIRRAIGRPGGFDGPAARHTVAAFGRALPMVVGKRVSPAPGTTVRVDVPDAGQGWTVRVGDDGRAAMVDAVESPTVRIVLSAEDFIVLAGGRRGLDATDPTVEGDDELGRAVLDNLAVTT
ncbi:uncharacterized protein (TIGR03083 family) [Marmoricola sp. URHA0025 HA25]